MDVKPLQELTALLASVNKAAGGKGETEKGPAAAKPANAKSVPAAKPAASSVPATKGAFGKKSVDKEKVLAKERNSFHKALEDLHSAQWRKRSVSIAKNGADVAGMAADGLKVVGKHVKGLGGAIKTTMIAQATMKGYVAANEAYARALNLPKPYGTAAAPAAAAMALAATAVTVTQIAAKKFEEGGPVDEGALDSLGGKMAELEGGEYLVSRRVVAELGGAGVVEELMDGPGEEEDYSPNITICVDGDMDLQDVATVRDGVREQLAVTAN